MFKVDEHIRNIILVIVFNINQIVLISWFIPVTNSEGDLTNWATILVAGGVFIPIAYYFTVHFSKK